MQVTGWGPTTRIVPGSDGAALPTNRSTAALQEKNVPLNPVSLLYRGGLFGADRGVRVGYPSNPADGGHSYLNHGAEARTDHETPPYLHPPANSRSDDGGGGEWDDAGGSRREGGWRGGGRGKIPPREIGYLMQRSDVRKTPAGGGGAPRNPSPLGAPLDDIEVPEAPAWLSVEGVRLTCT